MSDLSDEELREEIYKIARGYAVRRLGRRECSSRDIYQHLLKKGASELTATQVVSDLEKAGMISNERFSKMLVRQQALSGKGPNFIRQKLRLQGIELSSEEIKQIAEESTQTTELNAAKAILERRYPKAQLNRAEGTRAIQALLRRGYSFTAAKDAIRLMKNSQLDEEAKTDTSEDSPEEEL